MKFFDEIINMYINIITNIIIITLSSSHHHHHIIIIIIVSILTSSDGDRDTGGVSVGVAAAARDSRRELGSILLLNIESCNLEISLQTPRPPPQWTADEACICKCEYKEDLDKMLSKSFPQCRSTDKTAQLQFAIFRILFAQRTRQNVYSQ